MSRKGIIAIAVVFGVGFLLLALASRGYRKVGALQSMEAAIEMVRMKYPAADPVPTETLAANLPGTMLVDVREAAELAISRIPDAISLGDGDAIREHLKGHPLPEGGRLVLYDSVGERSARIVEELKTEGIAARYLEGGIFQWANEGRPLIDPGGTVTDRVHPYNEWWGRLLKRGRP